jgi:DNA repair exonuclease SbcCD ATPase subunit
VPDLAVIARDSQALTTARSALAQLLSRRAQLAAEAEPFNERLQGIDRTLADYAQAKQRVAELSTEHFTRFEQAIADGTPPPRKSAELLVAEAAAVEADEGRAAAERARERVASELQAVNGQLSALAIEIEAQVAECAVEAALDFARTCWRPAFEEMAAAGGILEGLLQELRDRGQRGQQTLRAMERLGRELAALRERDEQAAGQRVNREPARRLLEALGTDPSAGMEVD